MKWHEILEAEIKRLDNKIHDCDIEIGEIETKRERLRDDIADLRYQLKGKER